MKVKTENLFMLRLGVGALLISLVLILSGCADHVPVTGKDEGDPTFKGTQSETASAVSFSHGKDIFLATYNDDTDDGKITYTSNDRVVFPGASLLGRVAHAFARYWRSVGMKHSLVLHSMATKDK